MQKRWPELAKTGPELAKAGSELAKAGSNWRELARFGQGKIPALEQIVVTDQLSKGNAGSSPGMTAGAHHLMPVLMRGRKCPETKAAIFGRGALAACERPELSARRGRRILILNI